jgi:DNA-binding transcriptional ArsR family regulator
MSEIEDTFESPGDDSWYTAIEYQEAIIALGTAITPLHRRMLVAHAEAPDGILSVRQLAAAGGYDHPNVTYGQYGRLGRLIAKSIGVKYLKYWTRVIGQGFYSASKEQSWKMRPELIQALAALGWTFKVTSHNPLDDIAEAEKEKDFATNTQRWALVQARIGQGPFRDALLKYWGSCAVSGISEPAVLRASHIKPWRVASNRERLDPANGLLLAAHLDALFDAGLITFETDGKIRISSLLALEDTLKLGISPTMRLCRITTEHEAYMEHHRNLIFRAGLPVLSRLNQTGSKPIAEVDSPNLTDTQLLDDLDKLRRSDFIQ